MRMVAGRCSPDRRWANTCQPGRVLTVQQTAPKAAPPSCVPQPLQKRSSAPMGLCNSAVFLSAQRRCSPWSHRNTTHAPQPSPSSSCSNSSSDSPYRLPIRLRKAAGVELRRRAGQNGRPCEGVSGIQDAFRAVWTAPCWSPAGAAIHGSALELEIHSMVDETSFRRASLHVPRLRSERCADGYGSLYSDTAASTPLHLQVALALLRAPPQRRVGEVGVRHEESLPAAPRPPQHRREGIRRRTSARPADGHERRQ